MNGERMTDLNRHVEFFLLNNFNCSNDAMEDYRVTHIQECYLAVTRETYIYRSRMATSKFWIICIILQLHEDNISVKDKRKIIEEVELHKQIRLQTTNFHATRFR